MYCNTIFCFGSHFNLLPRQLRLSVILQSRTGPLHAEICLVYCSVPLDISINVNRQFTYNVYKLAWQRIWRWLMWLLSNARSISVFWGAPVLYTPRPSDMSRRTHLIYTKYGNSHLISISIYAHSRDVWLSSLVTCDHVYLHPLTSNDRLMAREAVTPHRM